MFSTSNAECLRDAFAKQVGVLPDLHLVDVGVSGGIHPVWRQWGDRLVALGLDVLENEVERLRASESLPRVRYEAVKVSGPAAERPAAGQDTSNYALHRSAAYLGTVLLSRGLPSAAQMETVDLLQLWREIVGKDGRCRPTEANYANLAEPLSDPFFAHYQRLFEQSIGASGDIRYTTASAPLDQIVDKAGLSMVDLLKIDTDGYELDVLRGAGEVLSRGCLAVEVEVQFHGKTGEHANVFANIDTFLRRQGFTLMKLDTHCYARSALPRPFVYRELPAQTVGGPIQWGDALYVRDLLNLRGPDGSQPREVDRRSVQIAAMILDIYDLGDAAAELVLAFPDCFGGKSREMLDVLAQRVLGGGSHADALRQFQAGVANYRRPQN